MPKFFVGCTIIYNGGFEVEAENWEKACEIAENELDYGNLSKEMPDSVNVGGVHFRLGEATADYAEEIED